MKTSVLYYCAFCFVVISTAMFGLDWQPATLSPMAPIKVVAFAPPPPVAPVKAAAPSAATTNPVPTTPVAPRTVAPVPAAPVAAAPPVAQTPPKPGSPKPELSKPLCDVAACAAAYRSFRESDCTYNPSFGPRRLCTKGVVPAAAAQTPGIAPGAVLDAPPPSIMGAEPNAQPNVPPEPQPAAKCNISACAAAYRSFRESDCTFNPSFGPRQICTK